MKSVESAVNLGAKGAGVKWAFTGGGSTVGRGTERRGGWWLQASTPLLLECLTLEMVFMPLTSSIDAFRSLHSSHLLPMATLHFGTQIVNQSMLKLTATMSPDSVTHVSNLATITSVS